MEASYETHRLDWRGLEIEVRYCPEWMPFYREIYGYGLAHIEVESLTRDPLPMTETGYRSHFERPDNIEAAGGPAEYVLAWLEQEAASGQWKRAEEGRRQMSLF